MESYIFDNGRIRAVAIEVGYALAAQSNPHVRFAGEADLSHEVLRRPRSQCARRPQRHQKRCFSAPSRRATVSLAGRVNTASVVPV